MSGKPTSRHNAARQRPRTYNYSWQGNIYQRRKAARERRKLRIYYIDLTDWKPKPTYKAFTAYEPLAAIMASLFEKRRVGNKTIWVWKDRVKKLVDVGTSLRSVISKGDNKDGPSEQ